MIHKKQLLSLSLLTLSALTHGYTAEHTQHAATKFVNSLGLQPTEHTKPNTFDTNSPWQMAKGLIYGTNNIEIKEPDAHTQLLSSFKKNEHNARTEQVVDKTLVNKMDLVYGEGQNPKDHLLSRLFDIDALSIPACERATALITQPTAKPQIAATRGSIVKAIAQDSELLNTSKACFASAKKGIQSLLYFDQEKDEFINEQFKKVYWQWFSALNNSVEGLEFGTRLRNTGTVLKIGSPAISGFITTLLIKYFTQPINWGKELCNAPHTTYQSFVNTYNMFATLASPAVAKGYFAFIGVAHVYGCTAEVSHAKLNKDIANLMQTQLINIADYLDGMKKLCVAASKNSTIKQNWNELKHLEALITPSATHSDKFNRLIKLLSTNTFKGDASFFSVTGRVLAAYQLIADATVRTELTDAINAFAEFEVYAALAEKVNASRNAQATYCFVDFIKADKPYINAVDFWNPFVDQNNAVTNSVELGGNTQTRNIILTGPNTGGKSTFAKGLTLNLVMAQTFGIAAARELKMTPFANLNCYLNISDDTAAKLSGLAAEVNRAKELVETVKQLKQNEFAFVIIDEIFTGTTPKQAEELAYKFIKNMNECENCIFLNPTHYQSLIDLGNEKNATKNCHMQAITDTNGKVLKYTYKLADGPSFVHNAEQVAQEGHAIW